MWEFLTTVLKEQGPVALAFAVVFVAFALVVRALWNDNQKLHTKLETIQEKRVDETKEVSEIILENTRDLDKAVGTLATAMDVLTKLQRRGYVNEEDEE